mgnify:CR=1 FL=1
MTPNIWGGFIPPLFFARFSAQHSAALYALCLNACCLYCRNLPENGHQTPIFEPYFKGIFLTVGCENIDAVHSLTTHRGPKERFLPKRLNPTGKAAHLAGLPKTICPPKPGRASCSPGFYFFACFLSALRLPIGPRFVRVPTAPQTRFSAGWFSLG